MAAHGFHQSAHLVARRGCGSLPSRARMRICPMRGRSGCMSAGWRSKRISRPFCPLTCRAPRSVVGDGPARAHLEAQISGGQIPGRAVRGGPGQGLCRKHRLRLSQPDRHFRPGPAGSAGLRPARGRLSGAGAAGRGGWLAGGRPGRGPSQSLPGGAGHRPPSGHGDAQKLCRGPFLARLHAAIPAQYHRRARRGLNSGRSLMPGLEARLAPPWSRRRAETFRGRTTRARNP